MVGFSGNVVKETTARIMPATASVRTMGRMLCFMFA